MITIGAVLKKPKSALGSGSACRPRLNSCYSEEESRRQKASASVVILSCVVSFRSAGGAGQRCTSVRASARGALRGAGGLRDFFRRVGAGRAAARKHAEPLPSSSKSRSASTVRRAQWFEVLLGTLFAERGYGATSTEEIAGRRGVGRATVFTSIGGKSELLKEAYRRLSAAGPTRAPARSASGGDRSRPSPTRTSSWPAMPA